MQQASSIQFGALRALEAPISRIVPTDLPHGFGSVALGRIGDRLERAADDLARRGLKLSPAWLDRRYPG
jgi:hypothetical protein